MLMSIRNPNLTDVFYDAALHNHDEILKYCNEFFNFIVGSGGLDFLHCNALIHKNIKPS